MARIRSVHPSFFTDEACVSCSPLARLMYIGLWTDADDQGLFEWRPLQLKMRLLPGDMVDAASLLAELEGAGLIASFDHAGRKYGAIREFRRFQRPKKPNAVHVLPAEMRDYVCIDGSGSEPVPHQTPTSGENPPQMEDEGEGDGETSVSLVAAGDESAEIAFEKAWRAYPHVKGRSSKPKAREAWLHILPGVRTGMLAAIARYRKQGREPNEPCGAPGFDKWLRDFRFDDWMEDAELPASAQEWSGPPAFRAAVVATKGEQWTRSWLDPTIWVDAPAKAIVCRLEVAAQKLRSDLKPMLKAEKVAVCTGAAA